MALRACLSFRLPSEAKLVLQATFLQKMAHVIKRAQFLELAPKFMYHSRSISRRPAGEPDSTPKSTLRLGRGDLSDGGGAGAICRHPGGRPPGDQRSSTDEGVPLFPALGAGAPMAPTWRGRGSPSTGPKTAQGQTHLGGHPQIPRTDGWHQLWSLPPWHLPAEHGGGGGTQKACGRAPPVD